MPWDLDVAAIWAETGTRAAEDAADAGDLARRGLLGELAAADAGIRGRRGPGQPGSARRVPGSSGSPAGGFGAGQPLDVAPGGSALLGFADRVAGDQKRLGQATDDEIIGLICALDRAEASACSLKHAAVAELTRRRPAPGCPLQGQARMPECWAEFAADEVRWALAGTRYEADAMLDLARALEVKLPGTRQAFRTGVLRQSKAEIIARATQVLDPGEARAAEAMVLGRAGRLSPGGLRAAIVRAVIEVAPDKARKRREEAVRDARVERWPEDSGNAALAGRELPPAQVLAADQRITWWARQLKAAGLEGSMDELRARAYLDLLLDQDSRPATPATPATPAGPDAEDGGGDTGEGDRTVPPRTPPGSGVIPAGFTGRNHLTVPLATLLELASRPGEIPGLGPVDPWLARDLARASAASPKTTWCLTVTDDQGHAIGHGCARPEPRKHKKRRADQHGTGPRAATTHPAGPGSPSPRRHGRAARRARAARRIRKLAVQHRHPRPARPADLHRPDRHRHLRSPLRRRRPRPRGQAPAPLPDPARLLHRTHVQAPLSPGGLRAQHPLRPRRPELPVQHRTKVPARAPAQARPPLDGRTAHPRHLPLDHPLRPAIHHRANPLPNMTNP